MKVQFPALEPWQEDVHKEIAGQIRSSKRFVIKASRQKGKTFLLKVLVLEYSLQYPNTESVIIEPVSSQCRRVFSELVDALEPTPLLKSSNASDCIIKLKNGSQITLKSGESKKAVRGFTCSGLCVLDEAAYLDEDAIQTILPICNVHRCPILIVSTPAFASGFFYNQWIKEGNNIYHFDWSSSNYDFSKYITKEMIDDYRNEYTPNKFKTEIEGEFITDSSFIFGEYKQCICEPIDKVPIYAGIDFAPGTGSDSTVIMYFNKYRQVVDIYATNTLSPTEQIDFIAKSINERPSLKKVLVEGNSIGEVYFSTIQSKLVNKQVIEKFMTTNDSKKEIIEDLILAFQKKEIGILDDKVLIKQLAYYDIEPLKAGNYTYNTTKDSIHDDYCIALAIGYHCFKMGISNVGFGFKTRYKRYMNKDGDERIIRK